MEYMVHKNREIYTTKAHSDVLILHKFVLISPFSLLTFLHTLLTVEMFIFWILFDPIWGRNPRDILPTHNSAAEN